MCKNAQRVFCGREKFHPMPLSLRDLHHNIHPVVGSENNSPSLVDEDDDRGGDGSSVFGKYYKLPRETAADSG